MRSAREDEIQGVERSHASGSDEASIGRGHNRTTKAKHKRGKIRFVQSKCQMYGQKRLPTMRARGAHARGPSFQAPAHEEG